jgi:hypothetical protein
MVNGIFSDMTVESEVAEFLRAHQPTEKKTWANHRECTCGDSYHTMLKHRDHSAHVAEQLLARFALQLSLTPPD